LRYNYYREENDMADEIVWEKSLGSALKLAEGENKHVLVDFFSPR
jgi:hypothetical protein